MLITAFQRALAQLPEPAFRGVLLRSVAMTICLFVALLVLFGWFVSGITFFDWDWLNSLLALGGFASFMIVLLVLFPAISAVFISFFLDDIAAAVEARFYPGDAPGRAAPFAVTFAMTLQLMAVMIGLNLLVMPIYLIFIFLIPPISLALYYGMNGYLLSREYFELVAMRHHARSEIRALRRGHGRQLLLAGLVIAFMLTIPIVNLLAPIIATAMMVHIFKHLEPGGNSA